MDKEFQRRLSLDRTIQRLENKIRSGKGTMKDAGDLGGAAGNVAAKLIGERMKEEFPNGQISAEDVRRVISPILRQMHTYVSEQTSVIINQMYQDAEIGLKAIIPEYDTYRENELVREISSRSFEDGFY